MTIVSVESFDGVVDEVLDVLHPNPTKGRIRVTANLGSAKRVPLHGWPHRVSSACSKFQNRMEVSLPLSAGMYLLELPQDRHLMRRVIVNR